MRTTPSKKIRHADKEKRQKTLSERQEAREESLSKWTGAVARITGWLALTAIFTLYIAYRAWDDSGAQLDTMREMSATMSEQQRAMQTMAEESKKQSKTAEKSLTQSQAALDAANKQITRNQRAYIYFGEPSILKWSAVSGQPITHWGISVVWGNGGNTSAHNVSAKVACYFKKHGDPAQKISFIQPAILPSLGPRSPLGTRACVPTVDDMENVKTKKVDMYLLGEVTYTDGFENTRRITRMVRQLAIDTSAGEAWGIIGPNNCNDTDCPKGEFKPPD